MKHGRDLYGDRDSAELPAFTLAEAAAWLHVPGSTVRAWTLGQTYGAGARSRRSQPVIDLADKKQRFLSFQNLVELHVLSAIRRQHRIPLQNVRRAVEFLEKRLRTHHPLATRKILTDGRDLLVELGPHFLNLSRGGQVELGIVDAYLERIEFGRHGELLRLFPFTTVVIAEDARTIVIDPRVQFGRPCIRGTGVPTSSIADRFHAGETIASLVDDFGVTREQVEDAIRYERVSRAA
ncbi:MAG: DUF433 domain-containing protein [Planctomycetes bacterium]|nr:DUF433 domain-containing protein [Planctomycetota bacterium]